MTGIIQRDVPVFGGIHDVYFSVGRADVWRR